MKPLRSLYIHFYDCWSSGQADCSNLSAEYLMYYLFGRIVTEIVGVTMLSLLRKDSTKCYWIDLWPVAPLQYFQNSQNKICISKLIVIKIRGLLPPISSINLVSQKSTYRPMVLQITAKHQDDDDELPESI